MVSQIVVVIPAYQPGAFLEKLVNDISGRGFGAIVVVNDGSSSAFSKQFGKLSCLSSVVVLNHVKNLGKGAAIKTAIRFVASHYPGVIGVVCIDADGQHAVEDLNNICRVFLERPTDLILGSRKFEGRPPFRSRLGNTLTRWVFFSLAGYFVHDTQTGLRGIPQPLFLSLLDIKSNRFDFELEMLMNIRRYGVSVTEVPIETRYFEQNKSSHFRPMVDSFRVWLVFLRCFRSWWCVVWLRNGLKGAGQFFGSLFKT